MQTREDILRQMETRITENPSCAETDMTDTIFFGYVEKRRKKTGKEMDVLMGIHSVRQAAEFFPKKLHLSPPFFLDQSWGQITAYRMPEKIPQTLHG